MTGHSHPPSARGPDATWQRSRSSSACLRSARPLRSPRPGRSAKVSAQVSTGFGGGRVSAT
eukprot:5362991-Pleurochrysis_carterae.AAC.1